MLTVANLLSLIICSFSRFSSSIRLAIGSLICHGQSTITITVMLISSIIQTNKNDVVIHLTYVAKL